MSHESGNSIWPYAVANALLKQKYKDDGYHLGPVSLVHTKKWLNNGAIGSKTMVVASP